MFTKVMLRINHVTKIFYQKRTEVSVVDDLSLAVKKGQVFGFLGANGAGKTTTLKMVVGLLGIDKGSITLNGIDSTLEDSRLTVGFMPETPQFYRHLKAFEVLQFAGQLFGKKLTKSDCVRLLSDVGLGEAVNTSAQNLSKGMHQRLGLAVALVNNPNLLILDEPLDGLDPVGRLDFKKLILQEKKKGTTIFFSSHILSDVEELCDEIAIINKGKLIAQGSPESFTKKSSKTLEEVFVEIIKRPNHATKH